MDPASPDLERFIERILAEQEKENAPQLDEAALETLARRQGLSESQWSALRDQAGDHHTRGRHFLEHSNWTGAIRELEQAYVITPHDIAIRFSLGRAYAQRFLQNRLPPDRSAAERLLRGCIRGEPDHPGAYRELTALEEAGRKLQSRRRLIFAGASSLAGIGLALILMLFARREASPETPPESIPSPEEASNTDTNTNTNTDTFTPEQGSLTLPVVFPLAELSEEFTYRIERSRLNRYPGKFSYELLGTIRPALIEISSVRGILELLDDTGGVAVRHTFDILPEYRSSALPGDSLPFRALVFEERPAPPIREVRLLLNDFSHHPFTGEVETGAPVTWKKGSETLPANTSFLLHKRSARRTDGGILAPGMTALRLNLTVTNDGDRAISLLSVHPEVRGSDGAKIPVSRNPIFSSIGPPRPPGHFFLVESTTSPLLPGERRTIDTIIYLPDAAPEDVGDYDLILTEAK